MIHNENECDKSVAVSHDNLFMCLEKYRGEERERPIEIMANCLGCTSASTTTRTSIDLKCENRRCDGYPYWRTQMTQIT